MDNQQIGIQFPAMARDLFLLQSIQTDAGAHPDSYSMGTGSTLRGGKAGNA